MNKILKTTSLLTALLFTGCVSDMSHMLGSNLNEETQQSVLFKTNQVHFMNSLKKTSSIEERNTYLDEFILKSDMQCLNYLNNPLKKTEVDSSKNSLYMSLFDTVSGLFGMSLVTNTAKAVFLDGDNESVEDQRAYANALSPEIRKGVELGRSRYAKMMMQKKPLDLKTYTSNHLEEDTLKYDKQCNDAYGLIEINRALKEMQAAVHTHTVPATPILNIDPKAIKDKVAAVSKEVEDKKAVKEQLELNTTKVVPTQLKL
ncbi:MAG: Unknown protein [uncultured Sulfurovum sp.]|uniref:Lipoprotein n=1 Tax=uncultured Sulfurovum sp. TaxID=269237 RepID=A0A6S6SIQ5_9BACT|nr:MAG: Unknown protein [uncultured Sulfurovum sp.]